MDIGSSSQVMAHANLSSFFDDAMPDGNERTCWNDFADDNDIEHNYPMEIDWLTVSS